jgi:S1-C subfamily serine protease
VDAQTFQEGVAYSDYLKTVGMSAIKQVVGIDTRFTQRVWDVYRYRTIYTSSGFGSGFVYDKDGHIVCDYTTVIRKPSKFTSILKGARGPTKEAAYVRVNFWDGKSYPARIIGYDDRTSIAVIKVDRLDPGYFQPITFADSSLVTVGEPLAILGFNYDTRSKVTVTSGIISALRTQYPALEETENIFFQVNYPFNMGNEGGILINLDGEMVAMVTNSAPYPEIREVHFALPENVIRDVVDQIIGAGEVRRSWFGFKLLNMTDELMRAYEIPEVIELAYDEMLPEHVLRKVETGELKTGKNVYDQDVILLDEESMGMFIISVEEDSPAEKAGLGAEDILWMFQDTLINKVDILNNELEKYDVGDIVTLTYLRRYYEKFDVLTTEFQLTYQGAEEE